MFLPPLSINLQKSSRLGLSNRYQEDEGFRLFCAIIDNLAFLPLNKIKEGMEVFKEKHTK